MDVPVAVKVASAAPQTGMGAYHFTHGTSGAEGIRLVVPPFAFNTTYTSTLTVSIATGP
jgi:hypothetical protein